MQRQQDLRKKAQQAENPKQKLGLLGQMRQLKQLQRQRREQQQTSSSSTQAPTAIASPDQRKRDEAVQKEVQEDLTKALTRTMRTIAGRWCDEDKARRIEESPAVQELLARTTGWVHYTPDIAKLLVVTGAKLL